MPVGEVHQQPTEPRELRFEDVVKTFRGYRGQKITAVQGVSLVLRPGQMVALVGESGSGKSTIARLATRLERPTSGWIGLNGTRLTDHPRVPAWVQMIFQDPFSSLNPRHTIGYSIVRPLVVKERLSYREAADRVQWALDRVGLVPARTFMEQGVRQLSGGQRQRANIARALVLEPTYLIADEPTSMLDVSVGLGILNLLLDVRAEHQALLFITHNLGAARYVCDTVVVLFRGTVVETGPIEEVMEHPLHPYTQQLIEATPDPERPPALPHMTREVTAPERWCAFAARCPYFSPRCEYPVALRSVNDTRQVRCVLYDVKEESG